MKFKMVKELSLEKQEVLHACTVFNVSRSGFYDWLHRHPSKRKILNEKLLFKIRTYWEESRKTYGSPRIFVMLKKEGECCGRNRVIKLMRENGIQGAGKKKFKPMTTNSNHDLPVTERIFEAENHNEQVQRPNQYWGGDITYIPTEEGWLYLAIFLDLFTRKIVGHAMRQSLHVEIVLEAMRMGVLRQLPEAQLIAHTDRGSQYAATEYRELLEAEGIKASMSRKGNCYDNAFVESFFHSLKVELVYMAKFKTRDEARRAIFEFIEVWYNRERIHSSIGYQTPVAYESHFSKGIN